MIEIEVEDKSGTSGDSDNEQANQISMDAFNMMPSKTRKKRVTVRQAKSILAEEAAEEMVDMEVVKEKAICLAEERGIIFIDEIDKIAGRNNTSGADVSKRRRAEGYPSHRRRSDRKDEVWPDENRPYPVHCCRCPSMYPSQAT